MAFSGERYTSKEALAENKRIRRLRAFLQARGWKPLKSDASPAYIELLYVSPCGEWVCKAATDEKWGAFIQWARDNPHANLPIVRKVHAWGNPQDKWDTLYVAVMERLDPLPFRGRAWDYKPRPEASAAVARVVRKAAQWTRASDEYTRAYIKGKPWLALYDRMVQALGTPQDLHGYNMMMRTGPRGGAPVLVLLDPYS